jgi:hypothetical protein
MPALAAVKATQKNRRQSVLSDIVSLSSSHRGPRIYAVRVVTNLDSGYQKSLKRAEHAQKEAKVSCGYSWFAQSGLN